VCVRSFFGGGEGVGYMGPKKNVFTSGSVGVSEKGK